MFYEAPSRLARWLLRLQENFGKPTPAGTRLDIKLSQQQLGSLIGVSRESVNKSLSEWQRDGVVAVEGGYITLHDAEALREIAGSAA